MKSKKKLCVACEISGIETEATCVADKMDLCKKHYYMYTGKFEGIIHEGEKSCKSKETE